MIVRLTFPNGAILERDEYIKIRNLVNEKALALMKQESKNSTATGFPISNFRVFNLCNRRFFSISSNSFIEIINQDILFRATTKYTEKFGTGNAKDVLQAIYFSTEETLSGVYENYKNRIDDFTDFIRKAHCYIIESPIEKSEVKILRLDLFRQIELNKVDSNKFDFTGGLFHSFKHFSVNKTNLSTGNDDTEIYHPINIIDFAIKGFFCSELEKQNQNQFVSFVDFDEKYYLNFIFYYEQNTNVYFINSIIKKKKKYR